MQLTLWTYEAPPHVGAMRVATAMEGVHYVLHAPQGDTYADLLFTMIERRQKRPPVTYTTFQARDLGGDTAELFKNAAREAYERFRPQAMIVGASCTAELIQDDPGGLARALNLPIPVVPLELPAYQKKENWGAAETFYQLVRALAEAPAERPRGRPTCNILGPTALGFRHRDDVQEVSGLLTRLGVEVRVTAPMGATPADLARLGEASFNVVLYPEIAGTAARGWSAASASPGRAPCRSAWPPPPSSWRRWRGSPASTRHRCSTASPRASPGTRARSIRPTSPASASSSSATPRTPSPRPASPPTSWASRWWVSAPTAASLPARSARPPRATASRR